MSLARQYEQFQRAEAVAAAQAADAAAAAAATKLWHYLDAQGTEHGPYELATMVQWQAAGYFTMDTQVRRKVDFRWAISILSFCCTLPISVLRRFHRRGERLPED